MYHRSDSDIEKWGDTSNSIQNNETHKKNVLKLLSMVLKAKPYVLLQCFLFWDWLCLGSKTNSNIRKQY